MSTKKTNLSSGKPSTRKEAMTKLMAADDDNDELKVRVNVELTVAARTKLKMHALKNRKTISQLIRQYVDGLPD